MTGDSSTPVDELWVVLRAQAGSRDHMEQLAAIALVLLRPRLLPLFDERADAEDVLQDVLFTICRRIGTLTDARLFRPWAHRVAMRAAWRAISRDRRHRKLRDPDIDPDGLADPRVAATTEDLHEILRAVTPASRVVLSLHYLDGLTLEATAAELGIAPGTVKSRLAYGLKQLRDARRGA